MLNGVVAAAIDNTARSMVQAGSHVDHVWAATARAEERAGVTKRPLKFDPTPRQLDVLAQLWHQDIPADQIAKTFGVATHTIHNFSRERRDICPKRTTVQVLAMETRECVRCGNAYQSRWKRRKYLP